MQKREVVKNLIKDTVTGSILSFALKQVSKTPKFQILDLIIPKERKIRSIVGGLETSLGTTLWEPLAKVLALQNGFEIIDEKLECPKNMPANLSQILQMIIEDRKVGGGIYDAVSSHETIRKTCQSFINRPIEKFEKAPNGRGVDIWFCKDGINYFFDTKTVQPNLHSFKSFMEQILTWYAYFYSRFPEKNAEARIVFPYNPHVGDFWEKTMGKGKPLVKKTEAWVEGEFWNFCSGVDNTYDIILEVFNELRESGEIEVNLRNLLD